MHWKAHLFRHFRLFQTFPDSFSQTLSHPCLIPLSYRQIRSHSALNSTFNSSALLLLHSGVLRFAFTPSVGFPHFGMCGLKNGAKIEQKNIITPMHCLAFPSALFGAPFHIDNRTVADCGFWLEYASKTPLEVVADLPHRMRFFRNPVSNNFGAFTSNRIILINASDSALLAWYERGISQNCLQSQWLHLRHGWL